MARHKIGWCSYTWNPAIGCKNHCEYCYARTMNKRFKFIKNWNSPEWKEKSFNKKFPKKPQRIFVGSMSEIYYWKDRWLEKVLKKVKLYPQNIFQFLTRYPEVYDRYIFPKNCWLGVTITREKDFERGIPYLFITSCNITFVSVEPILEYINPGPFLNANIDWVILGAETGNRKGKIIPKKEWIKNIVNYCKWNNIPVYLKDSLKNIYPEKIKMFPGVK